MATYKELQDKNNEGFQTPDPVTDPKQKAVQNSIINSDPFGESGSRYYQHRESTGEGIYQSPFKDDFFNSKILGIDLGAVTDAPFNPKGIINPFDPKIDMQKLRADEQSALSKLGAGVSQFVGKSALGIVGNIVGGFYGIGSAIANKDSSKIYDNQVNRNLDDASASIEAANTLFVNPSDGLGFNAKTGKELSDAFSFIAGAIGAEMVMQTAGNALGGMGISTLGPRMARYASIVRSLDNVEEAAKLATQLGKSVDEMAKVRRNLNAVNSVMQGGRRMLTTTGYESSLEARGAKDQFLADNIKELEHRLANDTSLSDSDKEKLRKSTMAQIERDADNVGFYTFFLNTAMLSVSNAVQFPTIFGNGLKKGGAISPIVRNGIDDVARASDKASKARNILTNVGRVLKNPATEFMEETGQGVASKWTQNYYETMLGTDTQTGALTPTANVLSGSLHKAIVDTYGTEEGRHEGYIGAIVGAVGIPGFKRGNKGLNLEWSGGLPGAYKEYQQKKAQTEDALLALNGTKMSELLVHNRDNAIRAAVDVQAGEFARSVKDDIELEAVENNKVFRYTTDRLSKGMDNFIAEDIAELKEMATKDIKKYRETFGKDETFEEADAMKEIEAFEQKTEIYADAYKKVHKYFNNFMLRSGAVPKKLADMLTYAVASEKLYGTRLEELQSKLFELNSQGLTKEEMDAFVATSSRVQGIKADIDQYISIHNAVKLGQAKVENEARKEKIKAEMDSKYTYLLDMPLETLQNLREDMKFETSMAKDDANLMSQVNKAIEKKEAYDAPVEPKVFDAKKSSKVRNKEKDLQAMVDIVNKELEEDMKGPLGKLKKPRKVMTIKELQKYLDQRQGVIDDLNKKKDTKGFTIDQINEDDASGKNLMDEVAAIHNKFQTALELAEYVFEFKKNPQVAYGKFLASELLADLQNGLKQSKLVSIMTHLDFPEDEIKIALEELEQILEVVEKKFTETKEYLNKEAQEEVDTHIENMKKTIDITREELKMSKRVEEQEEEIKKKAEAGITGEKPVKKPGETKPGKKADPAQIAAEERENLNNRLTIRELREDGTETLANPGSPSISEMIDKEKLKVGDKVNLSMASEDAYLTKLLKKKGLTEAYAKGKDKILKDPEVLKAKELDEDVKTYIAYYPVNMTIGDYNQFLYAATDEDGNNGTSLMNFRKQLLKNEDKTLALEVMNVDLGNFEGFKSEEKRGTVKERPVSELGFEAKNMTLDDIYYINQAGEYVRIDGNTTEHPLIGKFEKEDENGNIYQAGQTSDIYMLYKNKAGVKVPIKMNTRHIGTMKAGEKNYADILYDTMLDYFERAEQGQDVSELMINNTGIPVIDKSNNGKGVTIKDFVMFFIRPMQGKEQNPAFMKNLFTLIAPSAKAKKPLPTFVLYEGKAETFKIESAEQLRQEETKKDFLKAVSGMRFTVTGQPYIVKLDEAKNAYLDTDALQYLFDNNIINHTFDVDKNFDKIYEPGYNKGVVIHNPQYHTDYAAKKRKVKKSRGFDKDLQALLKTLGGRRKATKDEKSAGYETNIEAIIHSIRNGVMSSVRQKGDSSTKAILESIETIVNSRVKSILDLAAKYPQYLDRAQDHKNKTKILENDRILDKLLKIVYQTYWSEITDSNHLKVLKTEAELWGSKTTLLNEIKDARRITINKLTKKGDAATTITTKEQFSALMEITYFLKELVESEKTSGKGYINITYSKDYQGRANTKDSGIRKSKDDNDNKNLFELETRLRSVEIKGNPQWKKGKIVGGEVYLNVDTLTKGKRNNSQILLIQPEDFKPRKGINIVTTIGLPFVDPGTFEVDETAMKDHMAKIAKRSKIRKKAADDLGKKVATKTGVKPTDSIKGDKTIDPEDHGAKILRMLEEEKKKKAKETKGKDKLYKSIKELEKARQADLKIGIPIENYIKTSGTDPGEVLKLFRSYLTDVLGWDKMPIGYSKGKLTLDYLNEELQIDASIIQMGGGAFTYLEIDIADVINAKYDLEKKSLVKSDKEEDDDLTEEEKKALLSGLFGSKDDGKGKKDKPLGGITGGTMSSLDMNSLIANAGNRTMLTRAIGGFIRQIRGGRFNELLQNKAIETLRREFNITNASDFAAIYNILKEKDYMKEETISTKELAERIFDEEITEEEC